MPYIQSGDFMVHDIRSYGFDDINPDNRRSLRSVMSPGAAHAVDARVGFMAPPVVQTSYAFRPPAGTERASFMTMQTPPPAVPCVMKNTDGSCKLNVYQAGLIGIAGLVFLGIVLS